MSEDFDLPVSSSAGVGNPFGNDAAFSTSAPHLKWQDRFAASVDGTALNVDASSKASKIGLRRNWPPICPLVFHGISVEVPRRRRRLLRGLFAAWAVGCLAMIVNWVVVLILFAKERRKSEVDWLWASLVMVCGIPGSWIAWYWQIYLLARSSIRQLRWMLALLCLAIHIGFTALAAVGPSPVADWACGAFTIRRLLQQPSALDKFFGTLCILVTALWSCSCLLAVGSLVVGGVVFCLGSDW